MTQLTTDFSLAERLRTQARRAAGKALRGSPSGVQDTIRYGSNRLLAALGPDPKAAPPRPAKPKPTPVVWQSPQVPVPDGLTYADIDATFRSWSVNSEPVGHLDGYVDDSAMRFLHTWDLVREDTGRCLELGANPFFTTYLLDEHTDLDLTLANYYGASGEAVETVSYVPPGSDERVEKKRECVLFNVEEDRFPYEDDSFEVVLFCEMLEHMLMDPLHTLREIHRVLAPGGVLVLTTPNVARLWNVMALVNGTNMYDPYSGFGPYGRHNREYTMHELVLLLEFAGFEVERQQTADGHPTDSTVWRHYPAVAPLVRERKADLGHYLMVRARATGEPREGLPSFLFRSWPAGTIVEYP